MSRMDRFTRWLTRLGVLLAAALAGCGWFLTPGHADYGIETPLPHANPDPTLEITDLAYTPASPVTLGTEITFTATLNHPSTAADYVRVAIGDAYHLMPPESSFLPIALLYDNGMAPDAVASDGIYTGALTLPLGIGARTSLPVIANVGWFSSATPPSFTGEPMDLVLPEE